MTGNKVTSAVESAKSAWSGRLAASGVFAEPVDVSQFITDIEEPGSWNPADELRNRYSETRGELQSFEYDPAADVLPLATDENVEYAEEYFKRAYGIPEDRNVDWMFNVDVQPIPKQEFMDNQRANENANEADWTVLQQSFADVDEVPVIMGYQYGSGKIAPPDTRVQVEQQRKRLMEQGLTPIQESEKRFKAEKLPLSTAQELQLLSWAERNRTRLGTPSAPISRDEASTSQKVAMVDREILQRLKQRNQARRNNELLSPFVLDNYYEEEVKDALQFFDSDTGSLFVIDPRTARVTKQ